MKIGPKTDLFLNVLFAPCIGNFELLGWKSIFLPLVVRNHLPDGLWAYSMMSAMLLVWQRRIVTGWVIAACALSVGFEIFQYYHWIAGTGDLFDILTYFVFFGLALATNPIYEKQDKSSYFLWRSRPLRPARRLVKTQ